MERKDMKLGFIGFGNMAQAIAEGLLRSKALEPEQICACAKDWDKLCAATQPRGMRPCRDAREVAEAADVVIVAVKPHLIEEVLSPVRGQLADKAVVSVAAGWPFERYEALLPGTRHLSTMPNTPVRVCAGVFLLEEKHSLTPEEYVLVQELFGHLGLVQPVESRLLGIAGTLSGCGPAFVSMFIEALGDAGHGLPPCQPDGGGHGPHAGGNGRPPGRDEGRGVLARRHDHCGRGGAGARRYARGCHQRGGRHPE